MAKARAALHMLAGLGIRAQNCSVRAALRMWFTLVVPIMDYGVVLWGQGEWPAADQLQADAAAVILQTLPGTSAAALRGELGWQRLRARRGRIAVAYWSNLLVVNGASPERYALRCIALSFMTAARERVLERQSWTTAVGQCSQSAKQLAIHGVSTCTPLSCIINSLSTGTSRTA